MKDVLLVSENLLLKGEIPTDLLDPQRFDLRSVQYVTEIVPLSAALHPKIILLDLSLPEFESVDLKGFVKELQKPGCKEGKGLPIILGIFDLQFRHKAPYFFEAGINSILYRPFRIPDLQIEIENLLGIKFRKLERKLLSIPMTLSHGENTWSVTTKNINLENISVKGESLPSLGMNVRIKGTHESLSSFDCWAFCWREAEDSIILRFLNPSLSLLEGIQQLPKFTEEEVVPQSQTLQEESVPTFSPLLENPQQFFPIDSTQLLPHVRSWVKEEVPPPSGLEKILNQLTEFEKRQLLDSNVGDQTLLEIYTFYVFFQAQLGGMLSSELSRESLDDQTLQETFAHHENEVKKATRYLQKQLTDAVIGGDPKLFESLNRFKSELQKSLVTMQQTLNIRSNITHLQKTEPKGLALGETTLSGDLAQTTEYEDEYRHVKYKEHEPVPLKRARKKKGVLDNLMQKGMAFALVVLLSFALLIIVRFQWTAPARKISDLPPDEVKILSPYFSSVTQHKSKGKKTLSINLTSAWNELRGENLLQETQNIAAKLNVIDVEVAQLTTNQGAVAATYINGQIQLIGPTKELLKISSDSLTQKIPGKRKLPR